MQLTPTNEASLQAILPKGRYEILRLLGTGAFGQVFAGRDLQTATPVVLKLLQLRTPEARARIEREMAILKKLTASPELVRLIDGYFAPDATEAAVMSATAA